MAQVQVMANKCERCDHVWMPRKDLTAEPKVCPKCKSPYWDRPRVNVRRTSALNLYEMFGTGTLRYRDSAKKVVERLSKEDPSITIDFAHIDFASRSFLHELLYRLGNRKVTFENRNEEVENMMDIIERKAVPIIR